MVPMENISSRPTLDNFKFLYVFLSVRVPHIKKVLIVNAFYNHSRRRKQNLINCQEVKEPG